MPAAIVKSYQGSTAFGTAHSVTIDSVVAGNTILLAFDDGGSTTISNELCGATALTSIFTQPFAAFSIDFCFYGVENLSGGQTTVSWTTSSSVAAWYRIFEVSGLSITLDDTPQVASSPFSDTPSVNFTTLTDNVFALGVFSNSGSRTLTGVTAGYTVEPAAGSDFYFSGVDEDIGTAGAKTLSGTWGSGVGWQLVVLPLRASAPANPVALAWIGA